MPIHLDCHITIQINYFGYANLLWPPIWSIATNSSTQKTSLQKDHSKALQESHHSHWPCAKDQDETIKLTQID